mmetsp:Transcript_8894/g.23116  ORF Transcript_8894/g.23116 Transcript_8894/m.23116 type:complete len:85 (+) Transcript_8894:1116-1370(+)
MVPLSQLAALRRPIVAGYFFYGGFSAALSATAPRSALVCVRASRVAFWGRRVALAPISWLGLLCSKTEQRWVSQGNNSAGGQRY